MGYWGSLFDCFQSAICGNDRPETHQDGSSQASLVPTPDSYHPRHQHPLPHPTQRDTESIPNSPCSSPSLGSLRLFPAHILPGPSEPPDSPCPSSLPDSPSPSPSPPPDPPRLFSLPVSSSPPDSPRQSLPHDSPWSTLPPDSPYPSLPPDTSCPSSPSDFPLPSSPLDSPCPSPVPDSLCPSLNSLHYPSPPASPSSIVSRPRASSSPDVGLGIISPSATRPCLFTPPVARPHSTSSWPDIGNIQSHENEGYRFLRARLRAINTIITTTGIESRDAYNNRKYALAGKLSIRRKALQSEATMLGRLARGWTFRKNNTPYDPSKVDLHRLTIPEALARTDDALQEAIQHDLPNVRVIVGKGQHTTDGAAKLKPAIEQHIREIGLPVQVDPENSGALIVTLGSSTHGTF